MQPGKISVSEVEDFKTRIIYEDDDVLIFNKPAGMLSQRADDRQMSACEYLVGYLWHTGFLDADSVRKYRPSAVNRLDRNTSGLLVCAKSFAAARQLSELIRKREIRKHYLALVYGEIENKARLQAYLKKDASSNIVDISASPRKGYEEIRTGICPAARCKNMTLLDVELITGRTHQIRAHLSSMGHPIIGDRKYSSKESLRAADGLKRQFLHAYKLVFPKSGGSLANISGRCFTAQLPEELDVFLGGKTGGACASITEGDFHVTNFRG